MILILVCVDSWSGKVSGAIGYLEGKTMSAFESINNSPLWVLLFKLTLGPAVIFIVGLKVLVVLGVIMLFLMLHPRA